MQRSIFKLTTELADLDLAGKVAKTRKKRKSIWEQFCIIIDLAEFPNSFNNRVAGGRLARFLSGKVTNVRDYTLK